MAFPQTADPVPLPIPSRGMNWKDPLAAMEPDFSPWLLNWEPEPRSLKVRGGWHIHATLSDESYIRKLAVYSTFSTQTLFAYGLNPAVSNSRIYNVTAAGTQAAAAAVHTTGSSGNIVRMGVGKYGQRLAFVTAAPNTTQNRYYDPATGLWADTGFTYAGNPVCGYVIKSYKGRVLIFNGTYCYYSALAGVTGATTRVDFSSLFRDAGDILWAEILTSPGQRADDTYIAFGNANGEILIYSGDYPGADNWGQIAYFKVGPPIYWNVALQYNSDILLLTEDGVVSIRKLFSPDPNGDVTISDAIAAYWNSLTRAWRAAGVGTLYLSMASIDFWPDHDKVAICVNGFIEEDGTYRDAGTYSTFFIYNTLTRAWSIWKAPARSGDWDMLYFSGSLYRASENKILKYEVTSSKDEVIAAPGTYQTIPYVLKSAYTNFGSNRRKAVVGFEPIIKTDFTGTSVTMKAAADFERKVSTASSVPLLDGYQVPHYAVGVNGTFVQYRIEGESDVASSDGLELYSVGACIK